MKNGLIISSINEYLYLATITLAEWLSARLPSISIYWWKECVIFNLNEYQRNRIKENNINNLKDLDLSALLRITDRNWYELRDKFYLTTKEREVIKTLTSVRNNWAHCSGNIPSKDIILSDLNNILEFFSLYSIRDDIQKDIDLFIRKVINEVVTPDSDKKYVENDSIKCNKDDLIQEKSTVFLKSDPNSVGIVVSIDKIGDIHKYDVFINGTIKTYYSGQIVKIEDSLKYDFVDINRLISTLTAFQINNPAVSDLYSLNSARIDFVPYQFRPALKIIKSDVPRILIADSVGVGKTIETGLIIKELEARTELNNILIICPKPLVAERKWELEMKRFVLKYFHL